jgi:DDE superfamily endonuclease
LTGEVSCKDEARIGEKNGQVRQWARRGTRPRQPADQRYDNAYLFGAICPARGVGAALALPYADADMMQLHLDEISRNIAEGAHAVLLLDRAGWHTTSKLDVPDNITPIFLPSRAPELNPVENVWQYLHENWLSNTVFEDYHAIVEAACAACKSSSLNPKRSPPSECAIGLMSVSHYDPWYNALTDRSSSHPRRRDKAVKPDGRACDETPANRMETAALQAKFLCEAPTRRDRPSPTLSRAFISLFDEVLVSITHD